MKKKENSNQNKNESLVQASNILEKVGFVDYIIVGIDFLNTTSVVKCVGVGVSDENCRELHGRVTRMVGELHDVSNDLLNHDFNVVDGDEEEISDE